MIDIHSHIIFDVDDGAKNITESAAMLAAAKSAGITRIVATPHVRIETFDRNKVLENYEITRKIAADMGITLKLGFEVHWNYLLMLPPDRYLDYCTKNTNRMLIEFSLGDDTLPQNHDSMIYRLQRAGIEIVIAHPERYKFLQQNISCVSRWKEFGCKMQLDANSFYNRAEPRSKNTARKLLNLECYDYIASDAHSADDYIRFKNSVNWIERKLRRML